MGEPVTTLAGLLRRAAVLLIDFDGPIWSASTGAADELGEVLRAAQARSWRVGIVSNNDSDAIQAHLRADDELRRHQRRGRLCRLARFRPSDAAPAAG